MTVLYYVWIGYWIRKIPWWLEFQNPQTLNSLYYACLMLDVALAGYISMLSVEMLHG